MARLKGTTGFLFSLFLSCGVLKTQSANGKSEKESDKTEKAIDIYRDFWQQADRFRMKKLQEGKEQYTKNLQKINQTAKKNQYEINVKLLSQLQKTAHSYKSQLESFPNANNRPNVILNLAQVYYRMAQLMRKTQKDSGQTLFIASKRLVIELIEQYQYFRDIDSALYLKALVDSALGHTESAIKAWQKLAENSKKSTYVIHANVSLGDMNFAQDRSKVAYQYYQKAQSILNELTSSYQKDSLKIDYRLIWAAYRSAQLKKVLLLAKRILKPLDIELSNKEIYAIQQDTIELVGDALFEKKNIFQAKKYLSGFQFSEYASAIGLQIVERFHSSELHFQAARFGEHLIKVYPQCQQLPELMHLTAMSYEQSGKKAKAIMVLERLAYLLPRNSLWRNKFRDNFFDIQQMETLSTQAAVTAAEYNYMKGMSTNVKQTYRNAASFFEILIDFSPHHEKAMEWKILRANCFFFTEEYKEAIVQYKQLKTQSQLTPEFLEKILYQLVQTYERIWRESYAKAVKRGIDPAKDDQVLKNSSTLEIAIDEYVNKYPEQSQSIDLLLVGANSSRELGYHKKASQYWQRVLLLNPSNQQRITAIRGSVFAVINSEGPGQTIVIVRRFLRLEDWTRLGNPLRKELLGVLSTAVIEESEQLRQNGHIAEAGKLMVKIAEEFPQITQRAKIFRDGAYTLALASEWNQANRAAKSFLDHSLKKYRGDILYLLARSLEYQLRFLPSAEAYLRLGRQYPRHNRSVTGLLRASKLASSEDHFDLAAQVNVQLAKISRKKSEKMHFLDLAYQLSEKSENYQQAEHIAKKMQDLSTHHHERIRSALKLAKAQYQQGYESEALSEYQRLSEKIQLKKNKLGQDNWSELYGEVHFLLADDARNNFDQIELNANNKNKLFKKKTSLFSRLSEHFQKTILTEHPQWAVRARFHLAEACNNMANEISYIFLNQDSSTNLRTYNRYRQKVKRLKVLAQKNHSDNVILQASQPDIYAKNVWIKKSLLRIAGYDSQKESQRYQSIYPYASHLDSPFQWSQP